MLLEKPAQLSFVTEEVIDVWHSGRPQDISQGTAEPVEPVEPVKHGHCLALFIGRMMVIMDDLWDNYG